MKSKKWSGQKVDRPILVLTLLLMLFGVIAVSSASLALSFQRFGHNYYYTLRHLLFVGIGLALMYIVSRIDYHRWKDWAKPIMLAAIALLALVLVPGLGFESAGARRWFNIGIFLIQPSEFAKLAVIIYLASWFSRKEGAGDNFWFGILPPLLATGAVMALVVAQPDIGTTGAIAMIVFWMLFGAGARIKYLFGLLLSGAGALYVLIKLAPYRANRIISFLNPKEDPLGIGYHINQALLAIGSGGFWGLGLGDSRQKWNYLPEPIGDSIFAVMAEELGFLRIALVVVVFFAFAVLGLRLAGRTEDIFGRLMVLGIVSWIFFQALVNIGAITNILPLTGITLPFISYGGSSMLALSIAVGILLNISRRRV